MREKLSFVQPLSPFAPEMIIKAFWMHVRLFWYSALHVWLSMFFAHNTKQFSIERDQTVVKEETSLHVNWPCCLWIECAPLRLHNKVMQWTQLSESDSSRGISGTLCAARRKINVENKISAITSLWMSQMTRRQGACSCGSKSYEKNRSKPNSLLFYPKLVCHCPSIYFIHGLELKEPELSETMIGAAWTVHWS